MCLELRTRNSTIADKPRDAFVHCAIAWLTPNNTPLPICVNHAKYGCCTSKWVGISWETQKLVEGRLARCAGNVADLKHDSLHVLLSSPSLVILCQ